MENSDFENFLSAMRQGVVYFTYRKVDGSMRKAVGTLSPDLHKDYYVNKSPVPTPHNGVTVYWDFVREHFRTLRNDSLINWQT